MFSKPLTYFLLMKEENPSLLYHASTQWQMRQCYLTLGRDAFLELLGLQ